MIEWSDLFPNGSRVIALPSWKSPRLFMQADTLRTRWQGSGLFPAFRWRARMAKKVLRLGVAVNVAGSAKTASSERWLVDEFLDSVLPQIAGVHVLKGTPGPAEKTVVQLYDHKGIVIGYLKYSTVEGGVARIVHEASILEQLPEGLGPDLLKKGTFGDGYAIVVSPVEGSAVRVTIPPSADLSGYVSQLRSSDTYEIYAHPWVVANSEAPVVNAWAPELAERRWPVAIRHGDLAWNLRRSEGGLSAFDWEYGILGCLPGFDIASYVLQAGYLIYGWSTERAVSAAVEALLQLDPTNLSKSEAEALVHLAAYQNYLDFKADGQPDSEVMQQWRKEILDGDVSA